MGHTANPLNQPGSPVSPANSRHQWSWDDFFVAGLAVVSIPTAVVLICVLPNRIPAILPSVLLATGLAALIYRFLGGLEGASFQMGAFKAAGGLAAVVLLAYGVNYYLQKQDPDSRKVIYTITGTAVDVNRIPVPMDQSDVSAVPTPVTVQKNGTGSFAVDFVEEENGALARNPKPLATIRINHLHCPIAPNDSPADINQCSKQSVPNVTLASEPVKVSWSSFGHGETEVSIGEVQLNNQANLTPSKDLKQVEPSPAEKNSLPGGSPSAVTHLPPPLPTESTSSPQVGNQ